MKNILKLFFVMLLICAMTAVASAQQNAVTVTIDGVTVNCMEYGQDAEIVDGRTLVPLRAIFESLGASVEWNQQTKTVTSTLGNITINLTIGDNKLYRNGKALELDVPARIMNGRTMVPVRAISESFGVAVEWDAKKREVILTTGGYVRGSIDGDLYISEWMGLQFVLPEGYSFSDEDYLKDLMGLVADIKLSEIDIDKEILVYEFHISNGGSNASFFVEKRTDNKTLEEFIRKSATESFETMGVSYETGDVHTVNVGGIDCATIDSSVNLYGTQVYLSVSAFEKENFRIGVVSSYYDETTHTDILSCFKTLYPVPETNGSEDSLTTEVTEDDVSQETESETQNPGDTDEPLEAEITDEETTDEEPKADSESQETIDTEE